ncbi:unnamed protein product, partial [Rotaria sp. Silwood2]
MESIAEAVEKSKIVLVLERNYRPSGWLGIIMGGKMYHNFTKLDFDETFDQLVKEIDRILYHDLQPHATVLI